MMNIEERRIVAEPTEALEEIPLDEDDPGKSTRIGADLDGPDNIIFEGRNSPKREERGQET